MSVMNNFPNGETSLIEIGRPEGYDIIACLQRGDIPYYFDERGIRGQLYIEERYEMQFIAMCI